MWLFEFQAGDKQIDSHRWCDHAHFGDHHDNDTEPDRIVTEAGYHRQKNRDRQHYKGQGIHKTSTQKINEHNHTHDHIRRQIKSADPGRNVERNPGDGQKFAENNGTGDQQQDRPGTARLCRFEDMRKEFR